MSSYSVTFFLQFSPTYVVFSQKKFKDPVHFLRDDAEMQLLIP